MHKNNTAIMSRIACDSSIGLNENIWFSLTAEFLDFHQILGKIVKFQLDCIVDVVDE